LIVKELVIPVEVGWSRVESAQGKGLWLQNGYTKAPGSYGPEALVCKFHEGIKIVLLRTD
jgi:hypothetical protein